MSSVTVRGEIPIHGPAHRSARNTVGTASRRSTKFSAALNKSLSATTSPRAKPSTAPPADISSSTAEDVSRATLAGGNISFRIGVVPTTGSSAPRSEERRVGKGEQEGRQAEGSDADRQIGRARAAARYT